MTQKSIAVYCASSSDIAAKYFDMAAKLGKLLAENGITCINGAGNRGLMKALSDEVLTNGGHVKGVIPQFMVDSGWHHPSLSESIITDTMHARKHRMAELSDGVIALPGGVGTLEELVEIITWKQLGLYRHPIVIINFDGYYEPLLSFFERMIDEKFMRAEYRDMWCVVNTPEEAIEILQNTDEWSTDIDKYDGKNP